MKSYSKFLIKITGFSILLLGFVFGIFAQKKHANYLAINNNLSKYKVTPKVQKESDTKIACNFEPVINVERKALESRMFNTNFQIQKVEEQKKIEEWMLDPNFWKIKSTFEWEQEPIEEPAQLEEWMIELFNQNIEKADLFNGFVEKDWMKKHSFYIL